MSKWTLLKPKVLSCGCSFCFNLWEIYKYPRHHFLVSYAPLLVPVITMHFHPFVSMSLLHGWQCALCLLFVSFTQGYCFYGYWNWPFSVIKVIKIAKYQSARETIQTSSTNHLNLCVFELFLWPAHSTSLIMALLQLCLCSKLADFFLGTLLLVLTDF